MMDKKRTNNIADVVGNLEFAVGASTLGVDHALRNALAVKVRQQVDQVEVLQQQWTVGANTLRGLGIHDLDGEVSGLDRGIRTRGDWTRYRAAIRGCVDRSLVVAVGL